MRAKSVPESTVETVQERPAGVVGPLVTRIYLVGFMAAGKSAVGSALARVLGFRFEDLDRMIEDETGASIDEIFKRSGEDWFRDREHACLKRTEALDSAVIATGGGTTTFERNRAVIDHLGLSVWLDPPLEIIFERLERGGRAQRPLFRGREQARLLYHSRLEAYRMADLKIEPSSHDTASDVAARIASILRERNCVI